ncbi:MAG: hypothetical protein LQ349_009935, partial [Xanthoria aureola]
MARRTIMVVGSFTKKVSFASVIDDPDEYDQPNSSAYHNDARPPSPQRQRMYPQENGNGHDRDHGTPDNYGRGHFHGE